MSDNSRFIVAGPWSGGVLDSTATIKVVVQRDIHNISIVLSTNELPNEPNSWIPPTTKWEDANTGEYDHVIYAFHFTALKPNTVYNYGLIIDGHIAEKSKGKLKTFPEPDERFSFQFGFGSCTKRWDDHIFDLLLKEDLLFFFHLGDLHYGNLKDKPISKRMYWFDKSIGNTKMGNLFKNLPIAYTWDDHDFLDNNAGGKTSTLVKKPGAETALEAYDIYVPHYPLVNKAEGIYQSFQVGRVLFLLTDLRFNQTPYNDENNKQIFGSKQEEWLQTKLLEGKELDLIVMTSSFPYIVNSPSEEGSWGFYPKQRNRIAKFIKNNQITNLCMISGDAHMLAIDDGSHSGYANNDDYNPSSTGNGGFPVFHAASISSSTSQKGGPYSKGSQSSLGGREGDGIDGSGQYGFFQVLYQDENGNEIEVPRIVWIGKRVENESGERVFKNMIWHEFSANKTYSKF